MEKVFWSSLLSLSPVISPPQNPLHRLNKRRAYKREFKVSLKKLFSFLNIAFFFYIFKLFQVISGKKDDVENPRESVFILQRGLPLRFFLFLKLLSLLACENIRFSSLFAAGDVSRGGTSATQRQKFHTDDVKSVRNPVRSADWSME